MTRTTLLLAAAVTLASPALLAGGPVGPAAAGPGRMPPQSTERIDQPPVPDPEAAAKLGPPAKVERNGFVSVQVNVAADGSNIVGDAANEPSIAVDPNAPLRIAIGWRQFDSIASNFREAGSSWSADGGRSWAERETLDDGVFRSDPVLASDAEGRFYYYSLVSRPEIFCDMFISEDWGESWLGPIPAYGGDKAWFAIDSTGGPGHGSLYLAWAQASNQFGIRTFIRSFDGGLSYTEPLATTPTPTWGTLTVGTEGELYIAGNANYDYDRFVVKRSFDASDPGASPDFDTFFVDLGGAQGYGGSSGSSPNPVGLIGQVWIASDHSDGPNRGDLYLASSVNPPGPDPHDVHFARSTDGGASWSEPVRIHPDDRNVWQWFATMSIAPDGRLDVVWIESLEPYPPNVGELYYTTSYDGGWSWAPPVAITPPFDSWVGWPQQEKLGDYYHMVSDLVGADLAYAATFNGEQDIYYLRIGDTDCNGNGFGDSDDLAAGLADCNGNQLIDRCEIAAGTVDDLDGDGAIDSCRLPPRRPGGRLVP
ncbi:MAG TPA: sialidase family protein [Thermoanaerobaculales bacterium]|nr:sialidase family protein [Thermoanaerobaculales bacterium]HPA79663.1 sialidase family protein [Thermoanaerobaculales bacterium]HQL28968.1 sialidase family protein [Thermoanaerobaculales bacterium]HQN96266.1 sialidase family protein [Thermoanaerobaculales bacterium]HQP44709.1 sialidase family protein [Thermoanaerobaculales bacterium]